MLTSNEIKKQMALGNIEITNLKANALDKPNSCSVTLGQELYAFDYAIIDTKEKNTYFEEIKTGNLKKLKKIIIPEEGLLLEPQKVYLAKTKESIKTKGYIPVLNGKVSLSLLGVSIELNSGYAEENYNGPFILSIICTKPTIIYPNIAIGNLTFFKSLSNKSDKIGMLSGEEIKRRMTTGEIVISPDDNIVINPNSVNLTLNSQIGYYTEPVLDLKKENPIKYIDIGEEGVILYPDRIYVGRSNEWTETNNLIPMISGRSSLGRLGYHVHCSASMGSIGYKGYWHMGIRTTIPIKVYKNMKCCQIYYLTAEGEIQNTYEGSMQNLKNNELGSKFHKIIGKEEKNEK